MRGNEEIANTFDRFREALELLPDEATRTEALEAILALKADVMDRLTSTPLDRLFAHADELHASRSEQNGLVVLNRHRQPELLWMTSVSFHDGELVSSKYGSAPTLDEAIDRVIAAELVAKGGDGG